MTPTCRGLCLAAYLVLAGSLGPAAAQTIDTAAVLASARPQIDAANRAWVTGFTRHDAALVAAAYADSGLFVAPDGGVTQGREAIQRMYVARLRRVAAVQAGEVIHDGIAVVGADRVYEWGHAWLEIAPATAGGMPIRSGGGYLTVWQRQSNGYWRIVRNLAL